MLSSSLKFQQHMSIKQTKFDLLSICEMGGELVGNCWSAKVLEFIKARGVKLEPCPRCTYKKLSEEDSQFYNVVEKQWVVM